MKTCQRSLVIAWSALAMTWVWHGSACGAVDNLPASRNFTLDNGLQVFLQEKHDLPLTAIALAIDLGTKDETEQTSGYAHLLEHMLLFGGNDGRDGEARLAELRGHGVAHNAHTDHDLMTFEASCPAAESVWALERLRQAVFFGRLGPQQLESEKRIILEEILQLRDNPVSLGRMLVMQQLFTGHPYGQPVFGDGRTIKTATIELLQAFYKRLLNPGGSALAMVGDFVLSDMEKEIRRNWGALTPGVQNAAVVPQAGRLQKNSEQQIELDINESHLFFAWRAPGFNHEQRIPLTMLTHILGRGLNPLLNGVLRGGRQAVDQLDMSYLPLRGGGMVLLHLTLKEKNIRNARIELSKFLSRLGFFNFSRTDFQQPDQSYVPDFLESARNQMSYNGGNFRESAQNLSVAVARFMLLHTAKGGDSHAEDEERITSTDLRHVAGNYLSGKKCAVLAIVPLAGKAK